ncbi:MAG: threonine synthase [Bacteroidota bacterium]
MRLISTSGNGPTVTFQAALKQGIAPDGGLYFPIAIPAMRPEILANLHRHTFQEVALEVARTLLEKEIPDDDLGLLIQESMSFPVPLHVINDSLAILELFHGPTLAFKDFGARFMAKTLAYYHRNEDVERTILVATSGDTGSAVAQGFSAAEGIHVVLLYPSQRVSPTQELQLTTIGGNVTALEIEGTFDDCQRLVKAAFADPELSTRRHLTSANSINIARLVPQSFYYFEAWARRPDKSAPIVFSVPSGNLGNLTGGLLAWRMGLPVQQFIAATNANSVFTDFLTSGSFAPREAIPTLSNAMDVGNPSNLVRIMVLFAGSVENAREMIRSSSVSDDDTQTTITRVHQTHGYMLDPHGAVAFAALERSRKSPARSFGVVLETAHPAKFLEAYAPELRQTISMPDRLSEVLKRRKHAVRLSAKFEDLKEFLS